jgi:hypothetical protein
MIKIANEFETMHISSYSYIYINNNNISNNNNNNAMRYIYFTFNVIIKILSQFMYTFHKNNL